MTGYADRLTLNGVRHGTLDGYAAGCRARLSCPARHAVGLSCLEVGIRYAGDWPFRRLVDAGLDPAEASARIAAEDRVARQDARARIASPGRSRRRTTNHPSDTPRRRTRARSAAEVPAEQHGKRTGYDAGCRDAATCPAPAAGGEACVTVGRRYHRERWRALRAIEAA